MGLTAPENEQVMRRVYWTKERVDREARKYRTLTDFRFYASGAYTVAMRNGWLKGYGWFRHKEKWTRERCEGEALKYHSRTEMYRGSRGAYDAALRNGWMDDYWWFIDWEKAKGKWGGVFGEAIRLYAERGMEGFREEYRRRSADPGYGEEERKLYRYFADAANERWFRWAKLHWYYYYPEKRGFKKKVK